MANFEKCTVAMLGGPCSQYVTGSTSRLNQPQRAIPIDKSFLHCRKHILHKVSFCVCPNLPNAWWRHQMETFSALLAICAGNSPVSGEFPAQRPVTRRFEVFFDLRPNKRLSKQSWGWCSETPSSSLWRHRNGIFIAYRWVDGMGTWLHQRKLGHSFPNW